MALLKCFCFNDQKRNNKLLGEKKQKTCPDFGQKIRVRILGIVWTSALQLLVGKHEKLSSLDLTGHSVEGIFVQKVSFFCRHYFVLFLPSFDEVHVQTAWAQ